MTKESSKDKRKHVKEKSKKANKSKHDEKKSSKMKKHSHEKKLKKEDRHSKSSHDDKRAVAVSQPTLSSSGVAITVNQPITVDDHFFTKNEHFRVWLRMHRKQKSGVDNNYEALTSEQCRSIFSEEFAPAYNAGLLPALYYQEDIPLELRVDAQVGTRTQHKWSFLRKLTENDKVQLSDLAEDVELQTRNAKPSEQSAVLHSNHIKSSSNTVSDSHHLNKNPHSSYTNSNSSSSSSSSSRHEEKKRLNSMYTQEILPPKELDGRSRMHDQRKAVADKLHGAHQQKEEDRDGLAGVSESFLLGGGSDFQTALLQKQQAAERKRSKLNDRAQELASKQAERDAQWIQQLGIDPSKGRMTIKPRES